MGNPDNDRDKGGLSEIESPAIIIMALLALGNALASTHYKRVFGGIQPFVVTS